MPKFEQNFGSHNAGLEQVKVLYETKKDNYQKYNIDKKEDDKEIIKNVISDIFEKEVNKQTIQNPTANVRNFLVFNDDRKEDETMSNKTLEELIRMAFDKGIPQAINLSFKTSNAFLVDRLHDLLVDKFYEELIKREIIKK